MIYVIAYFYMSSSYVVSVSPSHALVALLLANHAQEAQCGRIARVRTESGLVHLFRVSKPILLVKPDRVLKRVAVHGWSFTVNRATSHRSLVET